MKISIFNSIFFGKIKLFFIKLVSWKSIRKRPKISLLIPLSINNSDMRKTTFKWLLEYWRNELPDAEVVIGYSYSKIFCKAEALNRAAKQSKGKVLVIIDADTYIRGRVINRCADRILEELDNHLWYVPYRHLYRLNQDITQQILDSDPKNPLRIPNPPPEEDIDPNSGQRSKYGHRYGAMIMMFPKEALETLGCFDERFKGWGGEDVALLRALDTLWGKHKTTRNEVLHLWHPVIGNDYRTRRWKGQTSDNPNSELAHRYHKATRHPSKMRKLVDEGCKYKNRN